MENKNEHQNDDEYKKLVAIEKKAPRYRENEKDITSKLIKQKCQSIWYNLLAPKSNYGDNATIYLREFFETHRCDHIHDMKSYRNNYRSYIGSEAYKRIIHGQPISEDDKMKASSSVFHYYEWDRRFLLKCLSWSTFFRYYFTYKPETSNLFFPVVISLCTGVIGVFGTLLTMKLSGGTRKNSK